MKLEDLKVGDKIRGRWMQLEDTRPTKHTATIVWFLGAKDMFAATPVEVILDNGNLGLLGLWEIEEVIK